MLERIAAGSTDYFVSSFTAVAERDPLTFSSIRTMESSFGSVVKILPAYSVLEKAWGRMCGQGAENP
jgi:hypothetical protein